MEVSGKFHDPAALPTPPPTSPWVGGWGVPREMQHLATSILHIVAETIGNDRTSGMFIVMRSRRKGLDSA
jgi:hypothetical protein